MSVQSVANPNLDLILERIIDVPRHLVWEAWTKPEHLKRWYCPKPYFVSKCEMDLRPGGIFHTTIESPEGEQYPYTGCFLEIIPQERLVWTLAMLPGFRPALLGEFPPAFTAILTLESVQGGTRYVVRVMHADEAGCEKHKSMGFHEGWGQALDQLVELVKSKMES